MSDETPLENSPSEDKASALLETEEETKSEEDAPAPPETEEETKSEEDLEEMEEIDPVVVTPPDDGTTRRWYAIHAHSGQEANVRESIRVLAAQENLSHYVTNVFVPMEEVAEFKSGEKRISKRKYFPGYVLIQLPENPEKIPELWHLIKETPGVTGFIGSRSTPVPLEDFEVDAIIKEIRGERERPRPKILYETGERVKVIDGPFTNFLGNIDEINEERGRLKILIEIFERLTSVEVEFWQVEKV